MSTDKIKVLYIAGAPRTGSTLLALLLGELDGFWSVGEGARALFNTRLRSQVVPCGCGCQVPECPFWKDIIQNIDGETEKFGKEKIRIPYLPLLMGPIKSRTFKNQLQQFLSKTEELYHLIAKKAGCRVIVDSSKNPPHAFLLSQIPSIDLYVVHLVRDPRGVMSSWSKPKKYLKKLSMRRVILNLWSFNFLSESLQRYAQGYLLVRYEDLVKHPAETLKKIANFVKEEVKDPDFLEKTKARIGTQHLLASNPDKYTQGWISIEEQGWNLSRQKHFLISLMTLPLLYKYGYPFSKTFSYENSLRNR